jgi:hypothetical protein
VFFAPIISVVWGKNSVNASILQRVAPKMCM